MSVNAPISLVVPSYNAGHAAETAARGLGAWLANAPAESEVIVVDDGSTDGSAERFEARFVDTPRARLLRLPNNRGKGAAVRAGVETAEGVYVVFTDVDLAYPPSEIQAIVQALADGADIAIANRRDLRSRFTMGPGLFAHVYWRHLSSRVFNAVVGGLLDLPYADCQAGLKGFRRDAATRVFERAHLDRFAFDAELLTIAARSGLVVEEVPVHFHYEDTASTVRLMMDAARALSDLRRVRRALRDGRYDDA